MFERRYLHAIKNKTTKPIRTKFGVVTKGTLTQVMAVLFFQASKILFFISFLNPPPQIRELLWY